ncbi:MAG: alpha/beta hydrolase [Candidatus Heimdallarchaeota archaeon]|nr:alpha/beta hydrolase [Candidatus Heimdallarchaeota archaeon]MCK4876852.1 alpha/beta hydrolase [Candidatus Heimdallarchaeota archaeon]
MPYVDNKGVKIHYIIEGEGPPIVMLHGGPGSHKEWSPYIDSLKDKYKLIALDFRGNGESNKPHESEAYLTKEFTSDIIAVLDDLIIEKAHCWGYSLGGHIAFCLSRDYPERFHSFIIGGAHPQELTKESSERINQVRENLKGGIDGIIAHLKERGEDITPESEKVLMEMDIESMIAWLSSEDLYCKVDEHLPNLDIPFLFYAGEKDEWNPYPYLLETSRKMKNAKTILFEEKGHGVQSAKELVLPHVVEFLEKI